MNSHSTEARRSPRIKEQFPVSWQIKDDNIKGSGRILNISDNGLLLEANAYLSKTENCVLAFEQVLGGFLPSMGRLIWSKKHHLKPNVYLAGIEFVEPAQEILGRLRDRIREKVLTMNSAEKTKNIVGVVGTVILAVLLSFILIQYFMIQGNYEASTRILLASSTRQASMTKTISDQLQEARAVLAQAQAQLEQIKIEKTSLESQLQTANASIEGLAASIEGLTQKNTRLLAEAAALEERLKPFEGQVTSLEDARIWKRQVKNRLHNIKRGIHDVKKELQQIRIVRQKEMDQLLLAQGNQGYFIRNAQPVIKNFHKKTDRITQPEKRVKISVDFVE